MRQAVRACPAGVDRNPDIPPSAASRVKLGSFPGCNPERKAPKHALAEIRDNFHRIVYATNVDAARTAYTAFERTQGSLPSEDAALILLFSLVASGQIKLRRIDGWRKIPTVLRQHTTVAA